MQGLKETIIEISKEATDRNDFNMFPLPDFIEHHAKLVEKYGEEISCYHEKSVQRAINMFLYSGMITELENSSTIEQFLKKVNLKKDDERVIPLLAKNLAELQKIVEPLKEDVIVYYGLNNDIAGVSLGSGKFVKSEKFTFHPLCGESAEKIKLFSQFKEGTEPRDYIIKNLGFMNVTTNFDWGVRYHSQTQSENFDTMIALKLPKGTPVLINQNYNKNNEYSFLKTTGRLVLFPGTTFVVYDKINIKYYLFDKPQPIHIGGICSDLENLQFLKERVKRIYVDPHFTIGKYGRDFDEQRDRARVFMYHEAKSYEANVIYAFPQITSKTIVPPNFVGKSLREINENIRSAILKGREKHWTNQQLSYMRKELFSQAIFNEIKSKFYPDEKIHIVDATGNIGGDSLLFALQPEVSWVLTYEMNPDTFKLLENNIALYGLNQIVAINERFSATEEKIFRGAKLPNTVIIIDPPYEYPPGPEKERFVYSIDKIPLIYMISDCLEAGAEMVVVTVPLDFTFNKEFAEKNGMSVECFTMGKKDMKIYMAYKSRHPKFRSDAIKMPAPKRI